jgi:ribosome recycling factor
MEGDINMLEEILSEAKAKMQSTLNVFEDDLQGMRGNRASIALVDRLKVEYYGQETDLRQLANLSTPEPMQIMIRPFDKGALKSIEKAINEANVGMTPNNDGVNIRLNMPPLTRERRTELVKVIGVAPMMILKSLKKRAKSLRMIPSAARNASRS